MSGLTTAVIGLGSGVLASVGTTILTRWLERRRENQFTVQRYAKPIWLACDRLVHRVEQILGKLKDQHNNAEELLAGWKGNEKPHEVTWMTGEGYYVTSTAYLLSSLSCWFHLMERQVVFLPFTNRSISSDFFHLVDQVKITLTSNSSLWFHYFSGLGPMLLEKGEEEPIAYGEFVLRLSQRNEFSDYFAHLFCGFLREAGQNRITGQLKATVEVLREMKSFLHTNATLPIETLLKTEAS